MRALALTVLVLSSCTSVEDTCPAEDLDCWAAHLETDLDGDPLTPSTEFALAENGSDGVPIQVGSSRAQLWVVGLAGKISKRANNEWKPQVSNSSAVLRAVWAAAENDVWAGGDAELLHFDGVSWSRVPSGLQRIDAISGSGSDDVWISAASQGVVHFDGAGFSTISLGLGAFTPTTVFVAARGDVWVGGTGGALAHGDGTTFTRVSSRTINPILGITALSSSDVYFVADQLFRGNASSGFDSVTVPIAVSGLSAIHSAKGLVWAVNGTRIVSGPRPEFSVTGGPGQTTSVWFDGATAFLAGGFGSVSRFDQSGTDLGAEQVDSTASWLAISGLAAAPEIDQRVSLTFDAALFGSDGGIPIEPGVKKPIPFTFIDNWGNRPGVCVTVCLRSSRCFAGPSLCRQPLPDQRIRGSGTLYVKENARAIGEPKLDINVGPIPCVRVDGGMPTPIPNSKRIPIAIPPGGSGGGGGSTGGGGGTGGGTGGGNATCAHCAEGAVCSGCGNIGRRCGTNCCAPNQTCTGNSHCATTSTSGSDGPLFAIPCGQDSNFTVQCGDGSCCGRCQTCSGDGRCLLP